jgi:hypothetical protein
MLYFTLTEYKVHSPPFFYKMREDSKQDSDKVLCVWIKRVWPK